LSNSLRLNNVQREYIMNDFLPLVLVALGLVLYVWLFWIAYVLVMGFYRAKLDNRLTLTTMILGAPFILTGLIMDVIANIVIAPIVFLDPPQELLVTLRLQRYLKQPAGWRNSLAQYICTNFLDIFDPSGKHCFHPMDK